MMPSSAGWAQPWVEPDVATLEMNSGSSVKAAMAAANVIRSMTTIEPLPSSTSSSSACTFALRISQRVPMTRVSYRRTRPRTNGHFAAGERVGSLVQPLGGRDDAAVRMAQRDGDRVATAHEHAFHEGLAAIGVPRTAVGRDRRGGGGRHRGKSTGDGVTRNRNGRPSRAGRLVWSGSTA